MGATQTNEAAITCEQWADLTRRLLRSTTDALSDNARRSVKNFIEYAVADFDKVAAAMAREQENNQGGGGADLTLPLFE